MPVQALSAQQRMSLWGHRDWGQVYLVMRELWLSRSHACMEDAAGTSTGTTRETTAKAQGQVGGGGSRRYRHVPRWIVRMLKLLTITRPDSAHLRSQCSGRLRLENCMFKPGLGTVMTGALWYMICADSKPTPLAPHAGPSHLSRTLGAQGFL